ncbi:AAA family ATPase [Polyangium jinanense]|uniref:histidine kinase n=1 Tax=Polyangium jinanense TaxID=2829994 RepID=A0A9X3X5L7_9BACT|nr:AAA family ATPase [Polyangium jinanense]MDC3955826.1 AAA family ATPase [Polyangium jinanense]MDC3983185.1 AAA family ATPase [Polyangium jinanense]
MTRDSRYVGLEILHEGADTLVFRARRKEDDRPVVLKVLRADHAGPRALGRLYHEYEIAGAMDASAVVKPYAIDALDGQPALVLEDFGGHSLDQLLDGPMPLERFFPLALRMTSALAELHRHHVIHKDIKPQNLLYNPDTGEVKITDLGIASRAPRESQNLTHAVLIEGTLAYMAPEQTGRMNRWIDERTDLYSLGVTFYVMLTGTLPFQASDPVEWVYCHIAQTPLPPHAIVPSVPPLLSAVVLKLLAKAAEDRYQSALGLRHDLTECFARWRTSGIIQPFALGQRDLSDRFQIPQRLYGREREVEALRAAFERVVAEGRPELVLVSGYSGIGKSSLVAELHNPVVRERGFFVSGKCDPYNRDIPYLPFLQAFRGLLQEILSASEAEVERFRERLREALGPNGRLLADVLPDIEQVVGPQAPMPELPAVEAQSRLHATLQRFVAVIARKEHPLVLFLDDLQWADAASLKLLEQLVTYTEAAHLLVLGAYRDNEVGPAHLLSLTLADVKKRGAAVADIVLAPLSAAHVGALVAEAVHESAERAEPLARLVYEKTGGNPFFVLQFLIALHQEGLIALDAEAGAWRWDITAIHEKGFTDNVVELMAGKLSRLSVPAQDALKLAACIGNRIDVDTLAVVAKRPAAELREALEEAAREGLILSQGGTYRFLHDRVQQAAYALIPTGQLPEVHLGIGRVLLQRQRAEKREETIFDIVGHLNRGAALLHSQAERDELAALNLRAGRKAKAAAAFHSAAALFAAGVALLAPDRWEAQYELTYSLTFERAHAAYATSSFADIEQLFQELMARARTTIERAAVVELVVAFHATRGQSARAVEIGLPCLRAFGIEISPHPTDTEIEKETERIWRLLGDRPIEDLLHLPPMTHPEIKVVMGVLRGMGVAAYLVDPNLVYLLATRRIELSLRHGNAESSAHAYIDFAMEISWRFERYKEAYRFGKVACDLADRSSFITTKSFAFTIFGHHIAFWMRGYRESGLAGRIGFNAAIESGDLIIACLNSGHAPLFPLACGERLEDVIHAVEDRLAFVRRAGYPFAHDTLLSAHGLIQTLRGRAVHFPMLDGSVLDQEAFEARLDPKDMEGAHGYYYILRAQALFVLGCPREAAAATTLASAENPAKIRTSPLFVDHVFYRALALAALCDEASPSEPRDLPEGLLSGERQLGVWASNCPENFLHKHALLRAEIARLRGQEAEAIRLYEQAISSAREHGFVQYEAIACELAAGFYRARGLSIAADAYLQKARAGYFRWGAHAKVEQLDQRYPHLVERKPIAPTVTFAVRAEQFDVLSVVKASQSISGELKLPRLLETLLRVVIEHAGADGGHVLLVRDERLSIAAAIEARGGTVQLLDTTERSTATLPQSILNYVRRTRERVLLDDATARHPFLEDDYFTRKRPRSLLCLPIVRQTRLLGMLYLENNLVTGAFTAGRLSVLELLASQSAISVENAVLYSDLEEENTERRRAEQALKAIIDNSAAAIYLKDREGRFLLTNRHVGHLLRVPNEHLLGKTDADLFPAPVAEMIRDHDRKVLEAGAPMEWEEEVPLADGLHTFLSVKFPLGEGTASRTLCGMSTDITERKQAERAQRFLAEASRTLMVLGYEATLDSVAALAVPELSDQCVVTVPSENDTRFHTAARGVPPGELDMLREALSGLVVSMPTEPEIGDARAAPLLQDRNVHAYLRVPLLARDRCLGVMFLLATAPHRRYGAADLALAEELGRRAALALDNARLYAKAQEAIGLRDEFLMVASHELKTPLASLQLQIQLVERLMRRDPSVPLTPARIETMLQVLHRQVARLGHLVDELLDVARLHSGRLTLTFEPVELSALTREVARRMAPQLASAGCRMELEMDAPVVGSWDKSRLEQVVVNLLSNAMKYGKHQPIHVTVRRQAASALLVVRDHGIGIAEKDQAKIFNRFERAVPAQNFGGLGLGLYLVHWIVTSHGGSVRVESQPNAGATFLVELPFLPPGVGNQGEIPPPRD